MKKANVDYTEHIEQIVSNAKKLVGESVIKVDPKYFRPAEIDILVGDYSKAKEKLGWEPTLTVDDLIRDMVENDLEKNYKEVILKNCGFEITKSCEI